MKNGRVKANATVAGAGLGVLVAFAWNGLVPEYPMPAEVAAAAAPVVGGIARYLAGFLPDPLNHE